jgi:protein-S-isoprenylcysteine O-methyltransferase Ste14
MLMLLRAAVILFCFFIREEPKKRAPTFQITFSWFGTFAPVLMVCVPNYTFSSLVGEIVSIIGLMILLFASIDLGRSFGISPAVRTPTNSGLYRYLRHPVCTPGFNRVLALRLPV